MPKRACVRSSRSVQQRGVDAEETPHVWPLTSNPFGELGLQLIQASKGLVARLSRQFHQNLLHPTAKVALNIFRRVLARMDVDHRHVGAGDSAQFLQLTRQNVR